MPTDLTSNYSGIVLNQNHLPTDSYRWRQYHKGSWLYQGFTLPSNYTRGSLSTEQRVPDLSGFQVLVSIDHGYDSVASLDYVFQYYDRGWITLSSGTVIGAHAAGPQVWYDVIFPTSIPVTPAIQDAQLRFGVTTRTFAGGQLNLPVTTRNGMYVIDNFGYTTTLTPDVPCPISIDGQPGILLLHDHRVTYSMQQGISDIWYVSPTPIAGHALQSDEITPLVGASASLNFRILGLTADGGTDFLGNEYRSAVTQTTAANTDTTSGSTPVMGSGESVYWMSPPQPSRFAVLSLYFDQRPEHVTPRYTQINQIGNPSFTYDVPGGFPLWWTSYSSSGGTVNDLTVRSTELPGGDPARGVWADRGVQALHAQFTFSDADQKLGIQSPYIPVKQTLGNAPVSLSLSAACNIITLVNADFRVSVFYYDNDLVGFSETDSFTVTSLGTSTISGSLQIPANASYVRIIVRSVSTGGGSCEAYVDSIQATFTSDIQPYFDGDDINCEWVAQRGNSPSARITYAGIADNYVVMDSILVDPITPNIAFNVYYTLDDSGTSDNMTERDWDQKLWTRVPRAFIATKRQQYVFPAPIHAKYVKVEFTNLQAQTYTPGNFQNPIKFKKFPTWVANFFIMQMELPSFVASQVNIEYNALQFAYDYHLDDLSQTPDRPVAAPASAVTQLTNYFSNNATQGIDPTTLAQINLTMNAFRQEVPPIDLTTSLGQYVNGLYAKTVPPVSVIEGGVVTPIDYSNVSSLQREPVVFEQSLPVMYFFLTCRHTYKEVMATFEYNRVYFAGVKDIAFMRNNYTVASDTPMYIESGGDRANINITDWIYGQDGVWYTY